MCSVFSSKLTYVFKCVFEGKIQWDGHTSVHYYYNYTLHWKISPKIDFVLIFDRYVCIMNTLRLTLHLSYSVFLKMYCIVLQLNYWYRETRKRDKIDFSQTAK